MSMTTHDALLAAVLAAPDDDLPRLVLADHYEGELGQSERAEFIRAQCQIPHLLAVAGKWAKTPSHLPGGSREDGAAAGVALAEAHSLQRREKQLADTHGYLWFPGVHRHLRSAPDFTEWPVGILRRGFLEVIRGPLVSLMVPGVLRGREVMPLRVEVTDREPVQDRGGGWFWPGGQSVAHPNPLPVEIWGMPQITEGEPGRKMARMFFTRELALSSLFTALLSWAKSPVG